MASKSQTAIYDQLWEQRTSKITKIHTRMTPAVIDKLEDECAGLAAIIKTYAYEQGQVYGHIACIIPQAKYRTLIGNPAWNETAPVDPGAYSTDALNAGNATAVREQYTANHKRNQQDYISYLAVQDALKNIIEYATGTTALAALKRPYIGFGGSTVHEIFVHLRTNTAIKMTESEKQDYMDEGYRAPWCSTEPIEAYFAELTRFEDTLPDRDITIQVGRKILSAGAAMWKSGQFTSVQMNEWETTPAANKTWPALQKHFIAKWQEQLSYNNMTASQTAFKEAALLAKEEAAAEQQELLFSLQQESHDKEMKTMKEAMEQMMTTIKALAAQVKNNNNKENKENKIPNIVAEDGKKKKKPMTLGGKPAHLKDEKSKCAHCKRWCLHLDKDCLELEENAANRSASWKTNKKPEE